MMDLDSKEVEFLKGILGSDYAKVKFKEIIEKFIDELKDIEGLDRTNPEFNKQIEFRLTVVDKLREITNRMLILSERLDNFKSKPM